MTSIIIVSYNTKKFILACLTSIRKYALEGTEIIVVDNNSNDGSVAELKTQNLKLIENKDNLGYAKAVNQGLKIAKGKYIFILNPDTKLTKGAIKGIVQFIETTPDVGIVGPRLLNFDGSIQPSCYHEPTLIRAFEEYFQGKDIMSEKYVPLREAPVVVNAVVGAAMFIPRTTIGKVGLFDERYFMYFEDLDYCRRARKSGLRVYYLPTAQIYHKHGGVTRTAGEQARNWLINSAKIYHGILKYTFLSLSWRIGQKLKRIIHG